jgi:hypothetical protein
MSYYVSNLEGVIYVKLTTGEEIIGELVESNEHHLVIKKCLQFQLIPDNQGRVGLQFIPFPVFDEDSSEAFSINPSAVVMAKKPSQDILNAYNQKYGSGIQVVGQGALGNLLNG